MPKDLEQIILNKSFEIQITKRNSHGWTMIHQQLLQPDDVYLHLIPHVPRLARQYGMDWGIFDNVHMQEDLALLIMDYELDNLSSN